MATSNFRPVLSKICVKRTRKSWVNFLRTQRCKSVECEDKPLRIYEHQILWAKLHAKMSLRCTLHGLTRSRWLFVKNCKVYEILNWVWKTLGRTTVFLRKVFNDKEHCEEEFQYSLPILLQYLEKRFDFLLNTYKQHVWPALFRWYSICKLVWSVPCKENAYVHYMHTEYMYIYIYI